MSKIQAQFHSIYDSNDIYTDNGNGTGTNKMNYLCADNGNNISTDKRNGTCTDNKT